MNEPVRIKICGIRGREALDASVAGGADFVGFVHWSGSPRHVTISDAEALAGHLPETTDPVGLFVDASLDDMLSCPFQWIQLHGQEDESMCRSLADAGKRIIRGIHFSPENIRRWQDCDAVERLLVDGSKVGGTGEGFDHDQLSEHLRPDARAILLAGGLTPENVATAVRRVHPWGVDVSSGVERSRGLKDPDRILHFCRAVERASTHSE